MKSTKTGNYVLTKEDFARFARQDVIVLNHLTLYRQLTVEEARSLYGIKRLACSINRLRDAGHVIITNRGPDNQADYLYFGHDETLAKAMGVKPWQQDTVRQSILAILDWLPSDTTDLEEDIKNTPDITTLIHEYELYLVEEKEYDYPDERIMLEIILNLLEAFKINQLQRKRGDELKKDLLKKRSKSK